jgi:hypothetical protein
MLQNRKVCVGMSVCDKSNPGTNWVQMYYSVCESFLPNNGCKCDYFSDVIILIIAFAKVITTFSSCTIIVTA